MKKLEQEEKYSSVFELKKRIEQTPQIQEYLKSEKRQKYSMGVFVSDPGFLLKLALTQFIIQRYYPELDDK